MALIKQPKTPDKKGDFLPSKTNARDQEKPSLSSDLEITEKLAEISPEIEPKTVEPAEEEKTALAPPFPPPSLNVPRPVKKDPHLIEVEKILEADLADTFLILPPETQQKFKAEGERVAGIIWQMLETAKVQIKRIAGLIRDWLKIIPGINRFFLEQETKIKTDQFIALAKKHGK